MQEELSAHWSPFLSSSLHNFWWPHCFLDFYEFNILYSTYEWNHAGVSSWAWWFHLTTPPVPSIFLFPNEACLVVYQAALQPGWALYPSTTAHTSNPDPLLAFSTILIPMQRTECRSPPLIWTILIENVLGFHCDFTFHVPNTQY